MNNNLIKDFDKSLEDVLVSVFKKPDYIRGLTHLLLMLYATRLAPELPSVVLQLFDNQYFKLFIFAIIIWTAQFSPSTSIMIAIAFMVSVNAATNKPLWEFLENVEDNSVPIAPSKEVAVTTAVSNVDQQMQDLQVVNNVSQQKDTIFVQPSLVDTPNGPALMNPTVVIAPAVVTKNGETMVIKPDVTIIEAPKSGPELAQAQAPAPALALEQAPAPELVQEPSAKSAESGCYPARQYDMSSVSGFEGLKYAELQM